MTRLHLVHRRFAAAVLSIAGALAGCATATAEDPDDGTAAGSDVAVVLPAALGGGQDATRFTESSRPATPHAYGIPLPIPAPPPQAASDHVMPLAVPASVDLSGQAPPVGDQGQTSSCQSWATGYSAMGWWANHVGLASASFAPMYLYSQIVDGTCSNGAYVEQPLAILKQQGIDTTSDYEPMQQMLDCAQQPSSLQRTNAGNFKISGYTQDDLSQGPEQAIKSALAGGRPAILSIVVYPEFENADSSDYLVGPPRSGDASGGGHAITAFAYDQHGVWIENQWGTGWGRNGWVELSWAFVNGSFDGNANVGDIDTIDGVALSCSDSNSQCAAWAQQSQCQENPDYMLTDCCASCANADLAYQTYAFSPQDNTSSCLDAVQDGTANKTKLDEYACNGTDAQTFTVLDAGHGVIHLFHPHSGTCVDDYQSSNANGAQIEIYHCNDTSAQDFTAQWYTDGSVVFQKNGTTSCIDVTGRNPANGTNIELYDCNNTSAQHWYPTAQ